MSGASRANFELSIVLPLGVIANQLMKVEADLRFLNAKISAYSSEFPGGAMAGQAAAGLEKINESLETIRAVVAEFEADIQPRSVRADASRGRTDRDD